MQAAGHLAFALLATEPLHARTRHPLHADRDRSIPLDLLVLFGAAIPDLIDKPLRLVGYTPHGRSIGHAIIVWALFTCIAALAATLFPKMCWMALLAYGWATHFVADTIDDFVAGFIATGYPWTSWAGWPWVTADDCAMKVEPPPFDAILPLQYWAVALVACWAATNVYVHASDETITTFR